MLISKGFTAAVTAAVTLATLLCVGVPTSTAAIETYAFTFENDMDLTNGPFGTLTVSDNLTDRLTFTIDIDNSKLGPNADIQHFGFQLSYAGTVNFDPNPTTIMGQQLGFRSKVAGTGNTSFSYVIDFGNGANPTLDPVTFVLQGSGLVDELDLGNLQLASTTTTNTGKVAQFAVHVQSTNTTAGSEVNGGLYIPVPTPTGMSHPEPNSLMIWGLLAAVGIKRRRA